MLNLEGREIGGVKLLRKVGEGGMGEVYLGEQLRVGNRLVAVKVVRPGDASFPSSASADVVRRFQREAALLGTLSHPNILPIYDSGVEGGYLYIVMPYAQEGSLADAIRGRFGPKVALPVSVEAAVDIIGQVAAALQYTHDHGIVHRDVKPGNVLIRVEPDGSWRMLLADFGVARPEETGTAQTMVTGTFTYMAPEQFSAKFSPASDQYALGIMAYQLLAGRPPFEGDLGALTRAHLYEDPPALRALNPAVSRGVEAVIRRALAKAPEARYPSVAMFAEALRAVAAGVPYESSPGAVIDVPRPRPPAPSAPIAQVPPAARAPHSGPSAPVRGRAWPVDLEPRPQRGPSVGRAWVAAIAAVLLLVALVGGTGLLGVRQQQFDAQQTAAAQTQAASSGTASPQPGTPSVTSAATTAPTGTITSSTATIPVATGTAGLGTDMTAPPPPPPGTGSSLLADAAPLCDSPPGPPWVKDDQTATACLPNTGGVTVTATGQASSVLACIEQHDTTTADGYASVLAAPQSGGVVLAFRLSNTQPSAGTVQVTGYYFKVVPSSSLYTLYRVDSAGKTTQVTTGSLPTTLAAHFALGASFKGSTITLYVNGVQIAQPVSDATFTTGWMGLCTDSAATFKDAQLFASAS